tara:strand:- start:773 stop:1366 length:594 start_codon:yes stop_codon:yes gene_type:complete
MSLSPVSSSPALSQVQLHQGDLSVAESSTDLKIEALRDGVLKKAGKEISSLDVQIISAKIGRIGLLTVGVPSLLLGGIGLVPIVAAEKAVKPKIDKMSTERWILKNFPESLEDEEIRGKAHEILNHIDVLKKERRGHLNYAKSFYKTDYDGDIYYVGPDGREKNLYKPFHAKNIEIKHYKKTAMEELHSFIEKKFYT